MAQVTYHRPATLEEALALLRQPGSAPLAGGSWLAPRLRPGLADSLAGEVTSTIDLADLGLAYVELDRSGSDAVLRLGAMTTLAALAQEEPCRQLANGLLAQAARHVDPTNLRHTATLGGHLMRAGSASELLLALLALDAEVAIAGQQARTLALSAFLADPRAGVGGGLLVEVRVPWREAGGGLARVSRTPDDMAIVAAAAVASAGQVRVAVGGVAASPLRVVLDAEDDLEQSLQGALQAAAQASLPLTDFRGSAEYRRAMASVMARRALAQALAA